MWGEPVHQAYNKCCRGGPSDPWGGQARDPQESSTTPARTRQGMVWSRTSPLGCAHPLDYSLSYRDTRECGHHFGAPHGIPLREKLLLLLFTSLLALSTAGGDFGNVPLGQLPGSAEPTALVWPELWAERASCGISQRSDSGTTSLTGERAALGHPREAPEGLLRQGQELCRRHRAESLLLQESHSCTNNQKNTSKTP